MDEALGIVLLAAYIVGVVALAAAITFAVVRIFPTKDRGDTSENGKNAASTDDAAAGGRLFRKAKRSAT